MHKNSVSQNELLPNIKEAFSKTPPSTRRSVKAINALIFYTTNFNLPSETYKKIFFNLLRGLSTEDKYLKTILYSTLIHMKKYTTDSFLAISSLTKDLNSDTQHSIKAKGLMTLFSLLPPTMINDFEKYISQGFSSRYALRKDAAVLVSLLNVHANKENARKWSMNMELIQKIPIKDYHALAFLSQIKEKGFFEKYFDSIINFKGPSLLFLVNVLGSKKEYSEKFRSLFFNLLRSNEEMIVIETARIICKLDNIKPFADILLTVLRPLLRSTKKPVRFAAMRVISNLSIKYDQVNILNKEIEDLVGSSNKTISMMAVTTLLKTGTEETIERLVEIIPDIVNEMSDSFKIVVISALENLSLKYQNKEQVFLDFMNKSLTEKGSFEFKKYIIHVMERIALSYSENGNFKTKGEDNIFDKILGIMSIYIEDSQSHILTMEILGIMGRIVGKSKNPRKYIIHILNRLILENSHVRYSALQSLYLISKDVEFMDKKIRNIISQYVEDEDDIVKNEALFLLNNSEIKDVDISFNLNDMPELKENILKYFEEEIEEEIIEENTELLKLSREIKLNTKKSDFDIFLVKKVCFDKIILQFRIVNHLENVVFKGGKIKIICRSKKESEKFEINIEKFVGEKIIEKGIKIKQELNSRIEKGIKIKQELNSRNTACENECEFLTEKAYEIGLSDSLIFNSTFMYEICSEEDLEDTEIENIGLMAFEIGFIEFMTNENFDENDLQYSNNFNLKIPASNKIEMESKIKNMIDLNSNIEYSFDEFILTFNGSCNDMKLFVRAAGSSNFLCEFNIKSNSEILMKRICDMLYG